MQIIIDAKMPGKAKEALKAFGNVIELETAGITYDAISGHPDIFFFNTSTRLIAAANLPHKYFKILDEKKIKYGTGNSPVGMKYPDTARYNAASDGKYIIHRSDITDIEILNYSKDKEILNVSQGYCRCSLLALEKDSFITSDVGISKSLKEKGLNVLYVSPEGILLQGFSHGFIGGTCGLCDGRVFFAGSLKYHNNGSEIKAFLHNLGYETVELYDGPLFDAGSILFLNEG
ncbi:MAG TPA: hypothetical protein VHO43_16615 [Ignavibacteriales bacterium]|nr:hypothetical protein [Ignavibacteriales bacterium]